MAVAGFGCLLTKAFPRRSVRVAYPQTPAAAGGDFHSLLNANTVTAPQVLAFPGSRSTEATAVLSDRPLQRLLSQSCCRWAACLDHHPKRELRQAADRPDPFAMFSVINLYAEED